MKGLYDDLEFFSEREFKCKCGCNSSHMDAAFLKLLDHIRSEYGRPMQISSGYRCKDHPAEARKARPGTGAHSTGKACDILAYGADAFELLDIVMGHSDEITGVGVNQHGPFNSRFFHIDSVDVEPGGALLRPNVWSYR